MAPSIWTPHLRPILVLIAILSVGLMGVYPVTLTVIDLVENPNGATGSLMTCNRTTVGSSLIAQNVSSMKFFHPRNATASASGVDPDLTPAEAYDQVDQVANATGISSSSLDYLIQEDIHSNEVQNGYLSPDYVNVNTLNLELVQLYPSEYQGFCSPQGG